MTSTRTTRSTTTDSTGERSCHGHRRDEDGELHPGEAVEEKISLSERFGLWVSFYPFSQDEYLAIAAQWPAGEAPGLLDEDEIDFFVQHYERITRAMMAGLPGRADLTIQLDERRRVVR